MKTITYKPTKVLFDSNSKFEDNFSIKIDSLIKNIDTNVGSCSISGEGSNNTMTFKLDSKSDTDKKCLSLLYTQINNIYKLDPSNISFVDYKDQSNIGYTIRYKSSGKTTGGSITGTTAQTKSNEPVWAGALRQQFGVTNDTISIKNTPKTATNPNIQTSGYFYQDKKTIIEEIERIKKLMKE